MHLICFNTIHSSINYFLLITFLIISTDFCLQTYSMCFKVYHWFISGQFSRSAVSESETPWTAAHQASPSITNSWSLLKLVSIEWWWIQPFHLLLSPSPPTFNHSQHHGLFKWVSSSHQVANILEFQFQHQSLQWIFRIAFFRMDWLDLLAVQGTLKSLLQYHISKASILQCLAFFILQPSHPYND